MDTLRPSGPIHRRQRLVRLGKLLLLALALNLSLEILSFRSLPEALLLPFRHPVEFLYNTLILFSTLTLALPMGRRVFALVLICMFWMVLGIINYVLQSMRITPLGFYDFIIFVSNSSISSAYASFWQIAGLIAGALLLVAVMVLVFRHTRNMHPRRRLALLFVGIVWGLCIACTIPYAAFHRDYSEPTKAYRQNGFTYSLLRSAVDRGIARPERYDRESISSIVDDVDDPPQQPVGVGRNFIFLQLESFLDPVNYLTVTCSENPVPTFSELKHSCSTGYLYVPMIGGGTANVEFEVLTGMRIHDFGTGEYPYTTVLQDSVCESIAYDLRDLGYKAHAIHSNTATFYQRHLVFPRLGFDSFTSLEYMEPYSLNRIGWCRDRWLIRPILDALNADPEPDVIFTVSVQGHGNYLTETPEIPYAIQSHGLDENPDAKNAFDYYVSQLYETDTFLSMLLDELRAYPEPVTLVAYGDHLPALDFPDTAMRSGSMLATEYVIWTNDDSLPKEDQDLSSYQLTSYVMNRYGISHGLIMCFHQQHWSSDTYLEDLHHLEYDMLYGDRYMYDGEIPYIPVSMRMGLKDIEVQEATFDGKALVVQGENFTRSSVIHLDDHVLDTLFVNAQTLVAVPGLLDHIAGESLISVAQTASDGTVLSSTGTVPCTLW